jgi:hypothetical protein
MNYFIIIVFSKNNKNCIFNILLVIIYYMGFLRKMISKNYRNKKILYLTIVLAVLLLNVLVINLNKDQNSVINSDKKNNRYINLLDEDSFQPKIHGIVEEEFTEEWLENGNFTSVVDPWFNTTEGDDTDVNATYSNGAANYIINGHSGRLEISDPLSDTDWYLHKKPNNNVLPNTAIINSDGCYVSHEWDENIDQTLNTPSAQWTRTVPLPVNMSDYKITSASIEAIFNASVQVSPHNTGGIDREGDTGLDDYSNGDYAEFYILIVDVEGQFDPFRVAIDNTANYDLGQDSGPSVPTISNTALIPVPQSVLISYLETVLSVNASNFNITLGIDIYCEDNEYGVDRDDFEDLLFKSVNFTMTFEKKMDQQTSLSWNQKGNEIPSGVNVGISNAVLNFSYQINETWSSSLSSNSEIRFIINDTQHSESIKLSDISTDWKKASFDVTYAVMTTGKGVNISLSIQLFLADEFELDRVIKISIDNVSLEITYTVSTEETPTELHIFLDGANKTLDKSIEVSWRETLNITVTYINMSSTDPILGATVNINGSGISEPLDPIGSNYSVIINSTDLAFGNNYLTLHAEKKFYESMTETIKITVVDRPTFIDNIYLNYTEQTSIEMQYNELLNITLSYNDTLNDGKFISGATVAINGSGISEPLPENVQQQYYTVAINTADMDIGINFLTITAEQENYTLATEVLTITVSYKDTYLEVLINNTPITEFDYYNVSIEEILNFTVRYKEKISDAFIDSATVEFIESGNTSAILKHPDFDQYNIIINTTDLGAGVKFITITARKDNYTSSSEQTALIIQEKKSEIQLFLDGFLTANNDKITREVYDIINVSVTFRDKLSGSHLSSAQGATVNLIGTGGGSFTENVTYEYYNFTLSAYELDEGITILTVIAEMPNYVSSSIQFIVEVTKQLTNLTIWFDGEDVTLDPSIELPIGSQLNLTVNFTDSSGFHISGANITLEVGYTANLTEKFNQYSIIINTNLLDQGVNIISFTAYRPNYEIQTENLRLLIRRIRTKIDTEDGEDKITIKPGESITIKIELKDLDFGGIIKDADVTYEWKHGDGDLDEEDDGIYEFTLEDVPEGTYTIEIFAFKEGGRYDFDDFEITLIVKRPEGESMLFQILLIIAIIVSVGLASYLIAYHLVLKYPKPVRKVRKYRRTLKKKKVPSVDITGREKAIKVLYASELDKSSSLLKGKTSEEIASTDKMVKKSLKLSTGEIIEDSMEKPSKIKPDKVSVKSTEKKGDKSP